MCLCLFVCGWVCVCGRVLVVCVACGCVWLCAFVRVTWVVVCLCVLVGV